MRVGSLFSGVGGLELGLERAGMAVVWQCESDPYARKVLKKHWPHVRCAIDVRLAHGSIRHDGKRGEFWGCCLEPVDLICGGFPCQDISVAGRGAGLAGSRSGLWREFARILGEVRPSWVLIENVPALRSRGLGTVLRDLSALGFDAEWDCLPASAFGAPHRRDRVFIVANSRGQSIRLEQGRWSRPRWQGAVEPGCDGQPSDVADTLCAGLAGQRDEPCPAEEEQSTAGGSRWWATEPNVGRVAHGVPSRVDRLRCLGNAVVPQVAEHVGRLILAAAS